MLDDGSGRDGNVQYSFRLYATRLQDPLFFVWNMVPAEYGMIRSMQPVRRILRGALALTVARDTGRLRLCLRQQGEDAA